LYLSLSLSFFPKVSDCQEKKRDGQKGRVNKSIPIGERPLGGYYGYTENKIQWLLAATGAEWCPEA
jgi:hypothetical protein